MPRARLPLLAAVLLLAAAPLFAQGAGSPKTLIIGFDGMDHALAQRFMAEGLLPNFSRLAEQGHFGRLETSNPAQSPVSWAVFNTGQNPGKTGVGGFVSRYFLRDKDTGARKGNPLPQPMLGFADEIPYEGGVELPAGLDSPELFVPVVAGAAAVVAFLLLKVLLGAKVVVALVLALGAGAGGYYVALGQVSGLPADGMVPYEINPMQGTNFWNHLDAEGVRMTGVQVASTFPPDAEGPNTRLLSGLGVKDISGSPGSWFVYTDDPWSWEESTNAGGQIKKVYFDLDGDTRAEAELYGPKDWVSEARLEADVEALEAAQTSGGTTSGEAADLEAALRDAKAALNTFRKDRAVKVPFDMVVDRAAGQLTIDVQGTTTTLGVGEQGQAQWSDFIPVTFAFNERFQAHGLVRFLLIRCDDEEVRVFVPPINIDPSRPPEWLPISSPPSFASDLAAAIGEPYETLGWACMTNPLKDMADSHFDAQAFLDDIVATMNKREMILDWAFDNADEWDVYYQVFSTVDRICHMLMREYDPQHPAHDAEYAAQTMSAFGRQFPLGDAVPEIYKEADRIMGGILQRMDAGVFGDDVLLMVVADHGFTSFRRGVNLNNLLYELGYLKTKDDKPLSEFSGRAADLLNYVDWERTQAYSMGLGKVFINLADREPKGIVTEAEYDAVVARIQADLMAVTDGDRQVFTTVQRRDELFSGPWWKEGEAVYKVKGQPLDPRPYDGFADLFVGYRPYYRVSWANTMGGLDAASVVDNTNHWSGGHVSVDPEHVPGVFFSNRKLTGEARPGLIDIGPTMLARYGLDPAATDMDGAVIPFENLTR